jgi:norsolorinic acid ketoreductase
MTQTIILISGANRGLGRAFLEIFLARPNHTVIAANRDPSVPTSQELLHLPAAAGSKVIVVKLDATVETDAAAAVSELQTKHGIDHIDIVIANAGVAWVIPTVAQLQVADLEEHMRTNVHGVVWLYQAVLPLLKKSGKPVWVSMGSQSGLLTNFLNFPNAAYGPTKVVLHWLTCAIHTEEPSITAFVVDPG